MNTLSAASHMKADFSQVLILTQIGANRPDVRLVLKVAAVAVTIQEGVLQVVVLI